NLAKWLGQLRRERQVRVKVPRFSVTARADLKEVLEDMGAKGAFGRKADFSGVADAKDLALGLVTHEAAGPLQEDAVKATSATGAALVVKPITDEEGKFIADRPFFFVIRGAETNTVLFVGRVTEPEKAPARPRAKPSSGG